jgi:hypothetical protein
VFAGILFVAGLCIAVAAIVFADDMPVVLAMVIAFGGGWCSKDGAGSLIRVYRGRRAGVGARSDGLSLEG